MGPYMISLGQIHLPFSRLYHDQTNHEAYTNHGGSYATTTRYTSLPTFRGEGAPLNELHSQFQVQIRSHGKKPGAMHVQKGRSIDAD